MYHSITFGNGDLYTAEEASELGKPRLEGIFKGVNTWDDWHLIPSSRPTISNPEVTTNYLTVPGMNGSIDATEMLTGDIVFGDRSGSIDFYVANDYEDWKEIRKNIASLLHGKQARMVLEDDPLYYYEGRFIFKEWKSEPQFSRVTIDYHLRPYKYSIYEGRPMNTYEVEDYSGQVHQVTDVIWDTFNFETDYDYTTAAKVEVL